MLYTALIAFIWYEGDEEEKNLNTLLDLLNESETREEDETYQNPVDMMFQELEERDPQHFAVRQYKKYKMAAGKTAKSILISCGARLAPFDIAELREIMSYDEMELDKIGDRKRVSEEGGVSSGRTENESQGQESPEDDQGWSGGRKPDR